MIRWAVSGNELTRLLYLGSVILFLGGSRLGFNGYLEVIRRPWSGQEDFRAVQPSIRQVDRASMSPVHNVVSGVPKCREREAPSR